MYVGGAAALLMLLAAFAIFASGPSGDASAATQEEMFIPAGRLTPEQARKVKAMGLEEYRVGMQFLARAGTPGTPGEQENLAEAREHFIKAQDHLARASETLVEDQDLAAVAERCGRNLYTTQKRAVLGLH